MNKPQYLIVHTEAQPVLTNAPRFDVVNQYHRQQFDFKSSLGYWCAYHYFIEKDGRVIQARADTDEGAHTKGYNTVSLGICLAGNHDEEYPTTAQVDVLRKLLIEKSKQYAVPREKIVPHRVFLEHREKTCYGRMLADEWARNLLPTDTSPNLSQERISLLTRLIALYRQLIALMQQSQFGRASRNFDHFD